MVIIIIIYFAITITTEFVQSHDDRRYRGAGVVMSRVRGGEIQ